MSPEAPTRYSGTVSRRGSPVWIADREMNVMRLGQLLSDEAESCSPRIASQAILHLAALPSGDAGHSLTFLFVRQGSSQIVALLHQLASWLF